MRWPIGVSHGGDVLMIDWGLDLTESIEKLQIKKDSDGSLKIIHADLTFTVSEFISHISNARFCLNKTEKRSAYAFLIT